MTAYTGLQKPTLAVILLCALTAAVGCASHSPKVQVLGVQSTVMASSQPSQLLVFVEVVNPGSRPIELSRLEYRVSAESWFRGQGQVPVSRQVPAGSSAVIEIPVPVKSGGAASAEGVAYRLEGRLFAVEDHVERSWDVEVDGKLGAPLSGQGGPVRVIAAE